MTHAAESVNLGNNAFFCEISPKVSLKLDLTPSTRQRLDIKPNQRQPPSYTKTDLFEDAIFMVLSFGSSSMTIIERLDEPRYMIDECAKYAFRHKNRWYEFEIFFAHSQVSEGYD